METIIVKMSQEIENCVALSSVVEQRKISAEG
jgi:hypothetical protein